MLDKVAFGISTESLSSAPMEIYLEIQKGATHPDSHRHISDPELCPEDHRALHISIRSL